MDKYPKRKQNRLKEYNYSTPGYYFVTICTGNKIEAFGTVHNDKMILNELGEIVKDAWLKIPVHFNNIGLNSYIIMPNHIHGIIIINNPATWDNDEYNIKVTVQACLNPTG